MIINDLWFSTTGLWEKQFQAQNACWGHADDQYVQWCAASYLSQSMKASHVNVLCAAALIHAWYYPTKQGSIFSDLPIFGGAMLVEFSGVERNRG